MMFVTLTSSRGMKKDFSVNTDRVVSVSDASDSDGAVIALTDGSVIYVEGSLEEVTAKLNCFPEPIQSEPMPDRRLLEDHIEEFSHDEIAKIDGESTLRERIEKLEASLLQLKDVLANQLTNIEGRTASHGTMLNEHHAKIGDLEVAECRMRDQIVKLEGEGIRPTNRELNELITKVEVLEAAMKDTRNAVRDRVSDLEIAVKKLKAELPPNDVHGPLNTVMERVVNLETSVKQLDRDMMAKRKIGSYTAGQ